MYPTTLFYSPAWLLVGFIIGRARVLCIVRHGRGAPHRSLPSLPSLPIADAAKKMRPQIGLLNALVFDPLD